MVFMCNSTKSEPIGSECVGCGYCCRKVPCGLARMHHLEVKDLYDKGQICPELRWDGKRYWCQVALDSEEGKLRIGTGTGCCANLNTDRQKIPTPEECGLHVKEKA